MLASAAESLTGKMAMYNYVVGGTWKCDIHVPAIGSHPAVTNHNSETFDVAPGNILHGHTLSAVSVGDDYIGYYAKAGMYWYQTMDSAQLFGWLVSRDGMTFRGYGWPRDATESRVSITESHTKLNANKNLGRLVFSWPGRQHVVTSMCRR